MGRTKCVILLAAMASALAGEASAKTDIVVLPRDFSGSKGALLQQFARAVMALTPEDELIVYAAPDASLIARIAVPKDAKAQNPAWLKRSLGKQFQPVLRYLETLPAAPATGMSPESLSIPDVLDELGRNVVPSLSDKRANILLLGSWLYFDARDDRYSMLDGFYPSDGLIEARQGEAPFGTADASTRLKGASVHYCWPGGQVRFISEEHEEAVRRATSLWTTAQSGVASTLSFDLATCFARFLAGDASGQTAYQLIPGTKPEMLRARPPVPARLPASLEQPGEYFLRDDAPISHTPPTRTTGVAWIGLKWQAPCDVDLYARPDGTRQWLFFGHVRTGDGYFNKDFLSATGEQQFEYIEFNRPIDLTKVEVAINLYRGSLAAGPEGVIRVWFDGQIYEAPFQLEATRGNGGKPPMTGPHWLRVDLPTIVGLARPETSQ